MVSSALSEYEKVTATFTVTVTHVNGSFNDVQVAELEEALIDFFNLEWPVDDTRGTVITDVHVLSQEKTTSAGSLRRHLHLRGEKAEEISLSLEITGEASVDTDVPYDFLGTIETVFDESNLVLRNSLKEDYGIAISFPN